MQLQWKKCQGNVWCSLNILNLDTSHFDNMEGVYIIWYEGDDPATVRVGQGFIRDRLKAHRNDPQIKAYAHLSLYVTWASVAQAYRDGVEAFLAQRLNPKVGERFPDRTPIEVNLPW